MRCREGLRHGFWVQAGYVVGAHLAGHFDPLLELLRRDGALSARAHADCVRALAEPGARAGVVASRVAGVAAARVRDVLRAQLIQRTAALLALAETEGHDAWFEDGVVAEADASVRMPLGSLLRRVERMGSDAARERRRQLRSVAKRMHPDVLAHVGAATQKELQDAFSRLTAVYHGFV